MAYLEPAEYLNYGLPAETSVDWIASSTALINRHCRRQDLNITQYTERLRITGGAHTVRLSYLPLASQGTAESPIVSVKGRYGQCRRGEFISEFLSDAAQTFGLFGQWSTIDPSSVDCDLQSGELTLAANLFGLCFNELSVTYTAGLEAIGDDIKCACAQIVRNAQAMPSLNTSKSKIDTIQIEYFSSSLVDETVRAWLRPYVANRLG